MKSVFPKKMNMNSSLNSSIIFLPMFLLGIILLCMSRNLASSLADGNQSDHMALLDFKNLITDDPSGTMKLWNDSVHFCNWFGITCGPINQRVTVLSLENQGLVGSLSPSVGNLTRLTGINLGDNGFRGEIPQEIGRLLYLRNINLSFNSFGGKIPTNMSHCTELRVLDLGYNRLVGTIPEQLSSLTRLSHFLFGRNNLTGNIPAWIGNFSSLYGLSLALNNLHGIIPNELGQLTNLGGFLLWGNNLSGTVPRSIYNISSISYFTVAVNQLEGKLPQDMGITLPNLVVFACAVNKFTGHVPVSFSNSSRLQVLDVARNGLTGTLPRNLGSLRDLLWLNFDENRLGSGKSGDLDVLSVLVNCTRLETLGLARNFFGGELPRYIANLSTHLKTLTMGRNVLHGSIPVGIENLVNLTLLGFEGNGLSGTIPDELGKLKNLNGLHLRANKFSGSIPSSLGNLTSLLEVFMQENRLEGSIPPSLGRLQNLLVLNLSSNNLNGSIPREVMGISSLSISLSLSNNSLTGSLPSEVGELESLSELDVSRNKLSSEIPSSLGKCTSLQSLHLEDNEFEGKIPESLESLRGLEYIDLSGNNLSGPIPEFLSKFTSLKHLDLAWNNFEGELSKEGIFSNASAVSVLGNDRLCGGVTKLRLPKCPGEKESRDIISPKLVIPVVSVASLVIILVSLFCFCYLLRGSKWKLLASSSMEDWNFRVSYSNLAESTGGFSAENLIGSGSFGSVYKGILGIDRKLVAVKVLNLQQQGALKSFVDECKALRSVRHRNLVKILTACSSIDHQGNDFKSLVFEYMANGNLDEWLHPRNEEQYRIKKLNFIQRLNIAIDVASALDYLHNHCQTPIVHCDLKPSNVLLNHDMVAHVSDFGLASFLFEASESFHKSQTMSVGLKGSIGYIPPEYGMGGQVSILGDSYSYGIFLLEMFTGKRPTDDLFRDSLSIHQFTLMALPDHVMDIVDPSLMVFEENSGDDDYEDERNESDIEEQTIIEARNNQANGEKRIKECLISVMHIGLLCSNVSPRERLLMSDVVNKMHAIRKSYLKFKSTRR